MIRGELLPGRAQGRNPVFEILTQFHLILPLGADTVPAQQGAGMVERRRPRRFRILYMDLKTFWIRMICGGQAPPQARSAPSRKDPRMEGPESLRNLGRSREQDPPGRTGEPW